MVDPNDPTQNTWYAGVYNGWGGAPNGLGGLYKTTDRGATWTRLNTIEGVTSVTFNPVNADQLFVATETDGLLMSTDINSVTPTFQPVLSYPFRQPHRIFFNPYDTTKMWVSSFGNGMKVGDMSQIGIAFHENTGSELVVYPNPACGKFEVRSSAIGGTGGEISIYNTLGEKVTAVYLSTPNLTVTTEVDVRMLPSGIYIVGASINDKVHLTKLIIE